MSEEMEVQEQSVPVQPVGQGPGQVVTNADKKGSRLSDILATVGAFVLFYLFGIVGGLICYGGYWIVRAIIKSKMSTALKVVLSVVVILVFLVLMIVFIVYAAALRADL